jgi:hypothetical protein
MGGTHGWHACVAHNYGQQQAVHNPQGGERYFIMYFIVCILLLKVFSQVFSLLKTLKTLQKKRGGTQPPQGRGQQADTGGQPSTQARRQARGQGGQARGQGQVAKGGHRPGGWEGRGPGPRGAGPGAAPTWSKRQPPCRYHSLPAGGRGQGFRGDGGQKGRARSRVPGL